MFLFLSGGTKIKEEYLGGSAAVVSGGSTACANGEAGFGMSSER